MNKTPATRADVARAMVEAMDAIRAVANAVARQPGFDRRLFAEHLREEVALLEGTRPGKSIAKLNLEEIARSVEAQE